MYIDAKLLFYNDIERKMYKYVKFLYRKFLSANMRKMILCSVEPFRK